MVFPEIMGIRYRDLQGALEALQTIQVPLVQRVGGAYVPVGLGDDKGSYYFIPALAKDFGLPLDSAIHWFYGFFTFFPLLLALAGFWILLKSWRAKGWAILGLGWFYATTKIWDVYLAGSFAVLCVIPFLLFAWHKPVKIWQWLAILSVGGLFCGYADLIRSNSGLEVVLFGLVLLALNEGLDLRRKSLFCLCLLVFFMIPHGHLRYLEGQRDHYLSKVVGTAYEKNTGHSFWHPVYIGLGYISNPYGIEYRDQVAYEKVSSIDPRAIRFSKEFEDILRDQVFLLAEKDPGFILKNIFVKCAKLMYYALKFGNLGWLALLYWGMSRPVVSAFLALGIFSALPSILVVPGVPYAAGFVAGSTVFGIYAAGMAIDQYLAKKGLASR